jgi:TRAP-type mannitol/chloroaromatic compound transport system permease large subunit
MLKLGYNKGIAIGCIQAGAALGFLIPPSVVAVIYALIAKVSIGKLFAAGLFPGLMLATMFILYIIIRCRLQPHLAPRLSNEPVLSTAEQQTILVEQQLDTSSSEISTDITPSDDTPSPVTTPDNLPLAIGPITREAKLRSLLALLPPLIVILLMMGSIFMGIATPVEASAMGAAASLIIVIARRRFTRSLLTESLETSIRIGGMIIWIFIGAMLFSAIYDGLGAKEVIEDLLLGSGLGSWGIIALMMVSWFIMGMFLDDYAILFICAPIYLPIIESLGFNPIWFGVLYMLNMQMAYLTPPFGYCLFMMKSVAPPEITMMDIYRSTTPFVLIQGIGLALCIAFPQIVMWFPGVAFN